jgi:diacylglycerol kinase (ATP)
MPHFKKVHVIINPASGTDEPILSYLNKSFKNSGIDWAVTVTTREGEVFEKAKSLVTEPGLDVVAVYGGDGSIMEAARALHATPMALAILPGGTANVMAKELNIPLESPDAIKLLTSGQGAIKRVDMGLVNGCPFLIRVNLGILADMVTETSPEMKDRWGQWAYGITAFQTMQQESSIFHLNIDGKEFTREAVALTVTNAGNIGKKGYSFLPDISVSDGFLDVIALDKTDMLSLLKVTGSMLFQKDSAVLQHWKAKEVTIGMEQETSFLRDDSAEMTKLLTIKIVPASLNVLVPENKN